MSLLLRCCWLLTIACCGTVAAGGITVIDDNGRSVTLSAPAQRIVTLAPHAAELVYAAGAGDRLVAVSEYSDYPPEAAQLPVVAGGGGVDLERIVALAPDLVIGWASGNPSSTLHRLEQLGIPVFLSEIRRLEQIGTSLDRIGQLAGVAAAAAAARARFEARLDAASGDRRARRPVSLFFQIDYRPLMTLGGHHLAGEVFGRCGARNVFDDLATLAAVVGREDVIRADPDVILVATSNDPAAALAEWHRFPGMRAVQNEQLYEAPAALMVRPTPRIVEGIEWLCTTLDRVRDASGSDR